MKIIKNYNEFLNESKSPSLLYYCFDWDDNLLFMPTKIHMKHLVNGEWIDESVSTEEFAKVRTDIDNWKCHESSFIDFRDFGKSSDNKFLEDVKIALENKEFGPSWNTFIKCLIKGSTFAIITARGHGPKAIRKGIEYIIYNILTDEQRDEMASNLTSFGHLFGEIDIMKHYSFEKLIKMYLDSCDFVGVSSPDFLEKNKDLVGASGAANPEKAKERAIGNFIKKINDWGKQTGYNVKLGFSDDDVRNVNAIKKYFNENKNFYDINFSIIDTSDRKVQGGKKTRI